jgi:hypothetical protein
MSHHYRYRAHIDIAAQRLTDVVMLLRKANNKQSKSPKSTNSSDNNNNNNKVKKDDFIGRLINTIDNMTMESLHNVPTGYITKTSMDLVSIFSTTSTHEISSDGSTYRRPFSFSCMQDRLKSIRTMWQLDAWTCPNPRRIRPPINDEPQRQWCKQYTRKVVSRHIAIETTRRTNEEPIANTMTSSLPSSSINTIDDKKTRELDTNVRSSQQPIPLWKQQLMDKRARYEYSLTIAGGGGAPAAQQATTDAAVGTSSKKINESALIESISSTTPPTSEGKERKTDEGREMKHHNDDNMNTITIDHAPVASATRSDLIRAAEKRGSAFVIAQLVSSIIHDGRDDTPDNWKIIENELMAYQSVTHKPALIWKRDPLDEARIARQKSKKQANRKQRKLLSSGHPSDGEFARHLEQAADTLIRYNGYPSKSVLVVNNNHNNNKTNKDVPISTPTTTMSASTTIAAAPLLSALSSAGSTIGTGTVDQHNSPSSSMTLVAGMSSAQVTTSTSSTTTVNHRNNNGTSSSENKKDMINTPPRPISSNDTNRIQGANVSTIGDEQQENGKNAGDDEIFAGPFLSKKVRSSPSLIVTFTRLLRRTISTILLPWLLTDLRQHSKQNETYQWSRRQPITGNPLFLPLSSPAPPPPSSALFYGVSM